MVYSEGRDKFHLTIKLNVEIEEEKYCFLNKSISKIYKDILIFYLFLHSK